MRYYRPRRSYRDVSFGDSPKGAKLREYAKQLDRIAPKLERALDNVEQVYMLAFNMNKLVPKKNFYKPDNGEWRFGVGRLCDFTDGGIERWLEKDGYFEEA